MLEVTGKHNQAKIFTDVVDQASIAQVIELCNQEFAAGSRKIGRASGRERV